MLEEQFPLDLEGVLELSIVGYVHPLSTEINGVWDVRVPDGSRRIHAALHFALTQTSHRAAMRAVNLQCEEFVAVDAHAPRGVEMGDDTTRQLEGRVGGVIGGANVWLPLLVNTLWKMGRSQA